MIGWSKERKMGAFVGKKIFHSLVRCVGIGKQRFKSRIASTVHKRYTRSRELRRQSKQHSLSKESFHEYQVSPLKSETNPHGVKPGARFGERNNGDVCNRKLCATIMDIQRDLSNWPFPIFNCKSKITCSQSELLSTNYLLRVDSAAVSIFIVILLELTNTAFVNSTNITTIIETAALSTYS